MPADTAKRRTSPLSRRLVELRRRMGYSQRDFGQHLGVSGGLVSQWEMGKKVPGRVALAKIASLTGVSLDYLIGVRRMQESMPEDILELETKLLRLFRAAPPTFRQNLINLLFEAGEARRELNAECEQS